MRKKKDSAYELIERVKRKSPEYLQLLTANTKAEFEDAFCSLLEEAVDHLEENAKNFKPLREEGLSAVLAGRLSAFGLTVTQEKNSNGHVDITIQADHCSPKHKKLCEAKIYDGPEYHLEGLQQLLGRYTRGREGRGLLMVYVRKKNIAGLIQKLRESMDKERPMKQKATNRRPHSKLVV